ncbi:MAG: tyrosine--tRNA ligase [candidate division Zixibacteria bacterium]|nr:tyrosine--tRNA ligase [candidate division Zixibacteria bacterium]
MDLKLDQNQQKEFKKQWEIITQNTVDVLPEDEFKLKLANSIKENRPLRIKQGFDPTSPDIHIGHAVGIRKLKQFQDLGHKIVLIVGDYTAMVGDPSGQSKTRPRLTYDEVMSNAETYQKQFFNILDKPKCEVRYNGEWFKKMSFAEVMELASKYTLARILERDDFEKRYKNGIPISIHELFYPLMQAYDSVAVESDVEIGGTDQKFNLLVGRTIQEAYNKKTQAILTMPILVGLDGEMKMSKSLGNYIGVEESPREIFGKVMSIPDSLIFQYFKLVTTSSSEELKSIENELKDSSINPMGLKKKLGIKIVDLYHPEGTGQKAKEEFERVFSQKKLPDEIPELSEAELKKIDIDPAKIYLVHLIAKTKMSKSNSEARKLIKAGAVTINNKKITDLDYEFEFKKETIIKVGKRKFLKLI